MVAASLISGMLLMGSSISTNAQDRPTETKQSRQARYRQQREVRHPGRRPLGGAQPRVASLEAERIFVTRDLPVAA